MIYFLYPQLRKLSGAERLILRLAAHTVAQGTPVTLVTNYFDAACRPALDANVRVIETGARATLRVFHNHYLDAPLDYLYSMRLLRHVGAEAEALTFFGPPSLPALAWSKQFSRRDAPHLYFCYEPPRFIYDDTREIAARLGVMGFFVRPFFGMYKGLDRAMARRADALLANSAFGAARLRAAYGRDATVITHGVDFSAPAPSQRDAPGPPHDGGNPCTFPCAKGAGPNDPAKRGGAGRIPTTLYAAVGGSKTLGQEDPAERGARAGLRERYGLAGKCVLLTVNFLHPRKRIDWLLRALPLIRAQVPNVAALIVGSGPEAERLEQLARDLVVEDLVRFTRFVPDEELTSYYALADLYVHTGKLESFGLSVLEASAAGVPVVSVNEGGPREIIADGETGRLVAANPEAVAAAVVTLLRDPARRVAMSAAARQRVAENYSWERGAEIFLSVVNNKIFGTADLETRRPS